ncbi:MAG TPA: hypothetical protein PK339_12440 [Flavitalea sp.]|nr:hypothetical protein [Flavitalea sp.]
MQVNRYNFLRWFNDQVDPNLPELPYAYHRDKGACGYMPIAPPAEAMNFYINSPVGFDYEDFPNLRLGMYRADGTLVAPSLGPLQQLELGDGTYHIYCSLVVPAAEYGIHYFRIYRNSTGEELLRSSYVLVRTDMEDLYGSTIYCRFRHDRFFYNTYYAELPGFYQQFRLNLSVADEQVESEEEVYREVSTGKTRTLNSYESKAVKIESYYFDQSAHEATALMFRHSYVELNSRQYSLKSAYKYTPNPMSKYTKGEAEIYDLSFASVNRC